MDAINIVQKCFHSENFLSGSARSLSTAREKQRTRLDQWIVLRLFNAQCTPQFYSLMSDRCTNVSQNSNPECTIYIECNTTTTTKNFARTMKFNSTIPPYFLLLFNSQFSFNLKCGKTINKWIGALVFRTSNRYERVKIKVWISHWNDDLTRSCSLIAARPYALSLFKRLNSLISLLLTPLRF